MPNSAADTSVHGHRRRLRARWLEHGLAGFHDYEVIELLLTYAIPRRDVKPIAKRLLARFGTLAGVFDAGLDELRQEEGMGLQAASFLRLIRQAACRYLASGLPERPVFDRPERVRDHLRLLLQGRTMECFGAIFTDQRHHPIASEILFEGTVDRAAVYPRNLLKRALELDARGMLLFHNHPAGTPQPSEADRAITRRIAQAAEPLELQLLDHFIVAGKMVVSLRESGWM